MRLVCLIFPPAVPAEGVGQPFNGWLKFAPLIDESAKFGHVEYFRERIVGALKQELAAQCVPSGLSRGVERREIFRNLSQLETERVQPGGNQLRSALRVAEAAHGVGNQIILFSFAHRVQDTPGAPL